MKTRVKTQTFYVALAACLNIAPVAVGQVPQTQPLQTSSSDGFNYIPPTPGETAICKQAAQLSRAGAASQHAGNYVQAEAQARQALSLGQDSGVAAEVLAAALDSQGKDQDALQAYKVMVVDQGADHTRLLLPYARLLLKSGQWAQAVAAYNQAVSQYPENDLIRASSHFSPDVPQPNELMVALHIAIGRTYNGEPDWAAEDQNTEAVAEYEKALQLAPDSDLANYYYGIGWQKLTPAEQAQFGTAQQAKAEQAKAALRKAARIGRANVKKAARKALLVAMRLR